MCNMAIAGGVGERERDVLSPSRTLRLRGEWKGKKQSIVIIIIIVIIIVILIIIMCYH